MLSIPTRGRLDHQQTMRGLSSERRKRAIIFCPSSEVEHLKDAFPTTPVVAQPDDNMTISAKRTWIMKWLRSEGIEKTIMLDDDLFFYHRYWKQEARQGLGDWRLHDSPPEVVDHWLDQLFERLSPDVPHGGFGPRQGNNNFPEGWVTHGSRMMLALGYHVPTALDKAEWGRIETREDMDISLQLLRQGLPNHVTHEFCVGQKTYGAPGGCTGQRTQESSDADAERLAELHPGLVRVVQKEYNNHPRKEVVVQWKRALQSGSQRS